MPKTGNTKHQQRSSLAVKQPQQRTHRTNKSISNVWSHRFFFLPFQMHIIPAYIFISLFSSNCQFCLSVWLFDCVSSKRFEIKLISNWQICFNLPIEWLRFSKRTRLFFVDYFLWRKWQKLRLFWVNENW